MIQVESRRVGNVFSLPTVIMLHRSRGQTIKPFAHPTGLPGLVDVLRHPSGSGNGFIVARHHVQRIANVRRKKTRPTYVTSLLGGLGSC
jgi:hypothetical protein